MAFTRFQDNNGIFDVFRSSFQFGEGRHVLNYQSQDRVENLEVLRSTIVLVDATPPLTSIQVGTPSYVSPAGMTYITPATLLSLSAEDVLSADVRSGLDHIELNAGGASLVPCLGPFRLAAGARTVGFRSVDIQAKRV